MNYDKYIAICKLAVERDNYFERFRSDPQYSGVVENMSSKKQGFAYVDILKKDYPHIWKMMPKFISSDLVGGPTNCFNYDNFRISPVTLRYVKVLADIEKCFGSLNGWSIVEIGGGYGGQCKIIQDYFDVKSYTMVDLPSPLELASKWLMANGIENVILRNHTDGSKITYDLFISNYAFTEFDGKTQRFYYNNVIKFARHGYIICNFMGYTKHDGEFTKEDVFEMKTNYKILPEEPETACDNFIYVW